MPLSAILWCNELIHHFYIYFFVLVFQTFNGKMNECMHVASSIMQIRTLGNIVTQHAATVYSCNEELLNFNKSKCSDRRCFITILIVKKKKKEHVACRVLIRAMLKMCSLSQFDGCCPCARIRKKTSGSTGPCCRHLQNRLFLKRLMRTQVFTWLTSICSMYKMYIVLGKGQSVHIVLPTSDSTLYKYFCAITIECYIKKQIMMWCVLLMQNSRDNHFSLYSV